MRTGRHVQILDKFADRYIARGSRMSYSKSDPLSLSDLNEMFNVEYKTLSEFKRSVLKPAVEFINVNDNGLIEGMRDRYLVNITNNRVGLRISSINIELVKPHLKMFSHMTLEELRDSLKETISPLWGSMSRSYLIGIFIMYYGIRNNTPVTTDSCQIHFDYLNSFGYEFDEFEARNVAVCNYSIKAKLAKALV